MWPFNRKKSDEYDLEAEVRGIGEGIAFAGLVVGCVWLELYDKPVGGLWALVVVWAIITDWGQKKKDSDV